MCSIVFQSALHLEVLIVFCFVSVVGSDIVLQSCTQPEAKIRGTDKHLQNYK